MAAEMAARRRASQNTYVYVYMDRIEKLIRPPGVVVKLRLGVGKTASP